LGRVFTAAEEQPGANQVIILSHNLWERRFGADANIVGRNLRVDGDRVTVIGVMPAAFDCPQLWGPIDVWRPLAFSAEQRQNRQDNWLGVVARLEDGISVGKAEAAMTSLAGRLRSTYPEINANSGLRVARLRESIGDQSSQRFAWLLLGLTGFVLLIACFNLANLQLSRAATRGRELAVRLAMGVSRWRLMRQLLVESLVLGLMGGAGGIILAVWLSNLIASRINHPIFPQGFETPLDARVLLFALGCAVGTGILFGVAPAWIAARTNMNDVLKASSRASTAGRSQNRLRYTLISAEVAFALILLTGAGLFISGLQKFIKRDPGWQVDGLLTGWLSLSSAKYASAEQRRAFIEQLEERLLALPPVERASLASSLPLWSFGSASHFVVEGRERPLAEQEPVVETEAVTPGYFATMGIRLREGRLFSSADNAQRPDVVVINEAMARHFWPGESPIGKRIGGTDRANPDWQEIIGVVNDIRFAGTLGQPDTPWQMYRALAQQPRSFLTIQLRARGGSDVSASVRRILAELDPELPLNELETARQKIDRLLSHFTVASTFLGAFAGLALVLASLGIYGVISYFVAQRTGEFGIRMALGAQLRNVLWLVMSKGLLLSFIGIVMGLGGAFVIARLLAAAVPELPTRDPTIFGGVTLLLVVVALIACLIPARRAAKVDPMEALRYE
jgi:putative ABC transport system permease protein